MRIRAIVAVLSFAGALLFTARAEARYFLPREGRFLSPDRAGMIDGPNQYQYVRGMPTMAVDPTGMYASPGPLVTPRLYTVPCYTTIDCLAVQNPVAFWSLMAALGVAGATEIAYEMSNSPKNSCDVDEDDDPELSPYYRGMSMDDVREMASPFGAMRSNYMRQGATLLDVQSHIWSYNIKDHLGDSSSSPYVSATKSASKADFFATHGRNPGGKVATFLSTRTLNIGGRRPNLEQIEFGSAADQEFLFPGQIPYREVILEIRPARR